MYDGYKGSPMNPLANIHWHVDPPLGYECGICYGRGGTVGRQDPVGDGVGFETFLNACPGCLGQSKCPRCGGPVDKLYYCDTEGCDWNPETIGEAAED